MDTVIETFEMNCRFGKFDAVKNLNLSVPAGGVYAFLGTNGAGKTTTIKALINLLPISSGSARVFGIETNRLGPHELAQIGYVSENQELPEALNVRQLIDYCKPLYPTWDDALCGRLEKLLGLPMNRAMKGFSRGMKIKAALLVTLAYRPRLLFLDEPFSGLDPLVRDELIQGILSLTEEESWTIFLSSHDVDEVERLADWVGIIDNGVLTLSESLDRLTSRFRLVQATLPEAMPPPREWPPDCLNPEIGGTSIRWIETHYSNDAVLGARIEKLIPGCRAWDSVPLGLREIFLALARTKKSTDPVA